MENNDLICLISLIDNNIIDIENSITNAIKQDNLEAITFLMNIKFYRYIYNSEYTIINTLFYNKIVDIINDSPLYNEYLLKNNKVRNFFFKKLNSKSPIYNLFKNDNNINLEILKYLVEEKVNFNPNEVLYIVCKRENNFEIVKYLFENGASDLNLALEIVCAVKNSLDTIKWLIEKGANS